MSHRIRIKNVFSSPPLLPLSSLLSPKYYTYAVGDLVQCRVVANWVLQRHPLRVCDVELLSWSALASVPGTGDPKYVYQPAFSMFFMFCYSVILTLCYYLNVSSIQFIVYHFNFLNIIHYNLQHGNTTRCNTDARIHQ